jgi:hypothetical protein
MKNTRTVAKTCRKCGETKQLEAFPPNRHTRDRLSSWCRECHVTATREWRQRRHDEALEEVFERRRRQREQYREFERQRTAIRANDDLRNL